MVKFDFFKWNYIFFYKSLDSAFQEKFNNL